MGPTLVPCAKPYGCHASLSGSHEEGLNSRKALREPARDTLTAPALTHPPEIQLPASVSWAGANVAAIVSDDSCSCVCVYP